jgi:hypothetical protein
LQCNVCLSRYFEYFFCDPAKERTPLEQHLAHQFWLILVEVWLDFESSIELPRNQLTAVYLFVGHIHQYSPFDPEPVAARSVVASQRRTETACLDVMMSVAFRCATRAN